LLIKFIFYELNIVVPSMYM